MGPVLYTVQLYSRTRCVRQHDLGSNIELCIFCGGLAHFLKTVARLVKKDLSAWSLKCAHLELRSVKGIRVISVIPTAVRVISLARAQSLVPACT